MSGIEDVRAMNGVLNITRFCNVGDVIAKDGSLSQVCLRMHLMADNVEELARLVDDVNNKLCILDENNSDMMLERLDLRALPYFKAYQMINDMRGEKY